MKSLEDLKAFDFKPLIGEDFDLDGNKLTLIEVDARAAPHPSLPAAMSLLFSGPEELNVGGVHSLSHAAVGTHDLLVHRVVDPEGARFEIIFG